ncbi:hypothetical protein L873DRAFT_1242732 [Choiromyces venosus 120613-1]|uniref:Uncharacterized protein n=1 Tax=Choiromyces venosus 120613-1 TaxID=1336337 RepID=A0A3N4JGY9_9PEZI|nr:hypothetical protein L873DRAFT_1242732 [Choiromyces venosus 120613-1]
MLLYYNLAHSHDKHSQTDIVLTSKNSPRYQKKPEYSVLDLSSRHRKKAEIMENHAKTSRISPFGLSGENTAKGLSFSLQLR